MASLVLGTAGGAINPVVGAIGAFIGAYLDQKYILPALADSDGVTVIPDVGGHELATSSEGTPMAVVAGRSRVGGSVIWQRPFYFDEVKSGGGGGGKQGEVISKRWFTDIAVAWARNEIAEVKRIWADGELIYNADNELSHTFLWDPADQHITNYNITEFSTPPASALPVPLGWRPRAFIDIVDNTGARGLANVRTGAPLDILYGHRPTETLTIPEVSLREATSAGIRLRLKLAQLGVPLEFRGVVPAADPRRRSAYFWTPAKRIRVAQAFGVNSATHFVFTEPHGINPGQPQAMYFDWLPDETYFPGYHFFGGWNPGHGHREGAPYMASAVDSITVSVPVGLPSDQGIPVEDLQVVLKYAYFVPERFSTDLLHPGRGVQLTQNLPVWKSGPVGELILSAPNSQHHLGSDDQVADPVIEVQEGVGNVPAFRGTAYSMLAKLFVGDWGNRTPNFMAEIVENASPTVKDAIDNIFSAYGVDTDLFDTSALVALAEQFRGLDVRGINPSLGAIQPILVAHDILARTQNGKLTFFQRDADTAQFTIPLGDLAATASDSAKPPRVQITDTQESATPRSLIVKFKNADNDLQTGTESDFRADSDVATSTTMDLGVVLRPGEARSVARRIQRQLRSGRNKVAFSLPPRWMNLQEGDMVDLPFEDTTFRVMLTSVSVGANYLVDVEGSVQPQGDFATGVSEVEREEVGDTGGASGTNNQVAVLDPYRFHVIDIAPLADLEMQTPGVYIAVGSYGSASSVAAWDLYQAAWGSTNYKFVASYTGLSIMGETLPDGGRLMPVSGLTWDGLSSIDVELMSGELSSATRPEVQSGKNRCLIGDEIVGFTTATLLAPRTYRLTDFYRGQLGTEGQLDQHEEGAVERFVLLDAVDGPKPAFYPTDHSTRGTERSWKVLRRGVSIDTADVGGLTIEANTSRPAPPGQFEGFRDNTDELTFKWRRRTRSSYRVFSSSSAPNLEADEVYKVTFKDSNGDTLRTKTVTDATTVDYTTSEQTTDGLTLGDPVTATVQKVSTVSGDGRVSLAVTI